MKSKELLELEEQALMEGMAHMAFRYVLLGVTALVFILIGVDEGTLRCAGVTLAVWIVTGVRMAKLKERLAQAAETNRKK